MGKGKIHLKRFVLEVQNTSCGRLIRDKDKLEVNWKRFSNLSPDRQCAHCLRRARGKHWYGMPREDDQ